MENPSATSSRWNVLVHDPFRGSRGLDRPATLFHLFEVKIHSFEVGRLQDVGLSKGFVVVKTGRAGHGFSHPLPAA